MCMLTVRRAQIALVTGRDADGAQPPSQPSQQQEALADLTQDLAVHHGATLTVRVARQRAMVAAPDAGGARPIAGGCEAAVA